MVLKNNLLILGLSIKNVSVKKRYFRSIRTEVKTKLVIENSVGNLKLSAVTVKNTTSGVFWDLTFYVILGIT
jgi:hypothetical protein